MARWSLSLRSLIAAVALAANGSAADAQRLVVSHDEWLTSSGQFNANEQAFMSNALSWFGAGAGSSVLFYANTGFLNNSAFVNFLTGKGITATTNAGAASFGSYKVVFVEGNPNISAAALASYVMGGGNVFYLGGTGIGGASGEAGYSNPFLNAFGLNFSSTYNSIQNSNVITTAFAAQAPFGGALFSGVNQIYADIGANISLTAPVANVVAQVFSDNAQNGVFGAAVYGGAVSTVPEPAAVILVAVGLLAVVPFARRRRR